MLWRSLALANLLAKQLAKDRPIERCSCSLVAPKRELLCEKKSLETRNFPSNSPRLAFAARLVSGQQIEFASPSSKRRINQRHTSVCVCAWRLPFGRANILKHFKSFKTSKTFGQPFWASHFHACCCPKHKHKHKTHPSPRKQTVPLKLVSGGHLTRKRPKLPPNSSQMDVSKASILNNQIRLAAPMQCAAIDHQSGGHSLVLLLFLFLLGFESPHFTGSQPFETCRRAAGDLWAGKSATSWPKLFPLGVLIAPNKRQQFSAATRPADSLQCKVCNGAHSTEHSPQSTVYSAETAVQTVHSVRPAVCLLRP